MSTKYESLREIPKEELDRLISLLDKSIVSVAASTNYATGERTYKEPVPEGLVEIARFSNSSNFLKVEGTEFEKFSEKQLEELAYANNGHYRPYFWAFED